MRSLFYLLLLASCMGSLPKDANLEIYLKEIESDEYKLYRAQGGQHPLEIVSKVEHVDQGIKKLHYTISNTGKHDWQGIVRFDKKVQASNARFFLPGFIYGNNRADVPMHPKCRKFWPRLSKSKKEMPYSNFFFTRSDRLSHPAATMYLNDKIYGLAGPPYNLEHDERLISWSPNIDGRFNTFNGFGCALDEDQVSISYFLGYENAPWLYVANDIIEYQELKKENAVSIAPGEQLEVTIYLYELEAEDERELNTVLKHVYDVYHEPPRQGNSVASSLEDLSTALMQDAYVKEAKNYATSVRFNDSLIHDPIFSIAWTGGIQVASPMLLAGTVQNNNEMRQQAIESIQNVVDNAINEKSGLPFDAYYNGEWNTNGWWQHYLWKPLEDITAHSSYVVGQALYYILYAYAIEKDLGIKHDDWLQFVKNVSDRIELTKNEAGEYPYRFSVKNGDAIDYNSFGGAWCLATRAYLGILLADDGLIEQTRKSMHHYWRQYIKKMECYGTPHDTWRATEEEGILGFIKAAALLHQYTNDDKFLQYLQDAIDYEFTWKYMYNVPVQVPPLSKLNWSSSGASGTSIANPHVHPMGCIIYQEVVYLANQLNNPYYHQRSEDILQWVVQSYNREANDFDFGRKGWMPERFCVSEGLVIEKYPNGDPASIWFLYHPWAAGSAIEALANKLYQQ